MTKSVDIRAHIVDVFRRDLIGPGPQDADLANERLNESPARWYLAGFLAPAEDPLALDGMMTRTIRPPRKKWNRRRGAGCRWRWRCATDNEEPEAPNARRRFLPSSVGLTVLLDPDVTSIEARVSWGDYRTEPPLPEAILLPEPLPEEIGEDGKPKRIERPWSNGFGARKTGSSLFP